MKQIIFNLIILIYPIVLLAQGTNKELCKIELEELTKKSFITYFTNCADERKFYLTGENHHAESTNKITLEFIRYLLEENELNFIFLESGKSFSDCLNEYMESGDELYLEWVLESYNREDEDYFNLYKEIRKINEDNNKKVRFEGVDVEYSLRGVTNVIIKKYSSLIPIEQIENLERLLKQNFLKKRVEKEFFEIISKIETSVNSKEETDAIELLEIIEGLYNYKSNWFKRDLLMSRKITQFYVEEEVTGYMSIGLQHMKNKGKVVKNIRYYLNQELGSNNLFTTMINCINCKNLDGSKIATFAKDKKTQKKYSFEKGEDKYNLWLIINEKSEKK